MIGPIDTPQEFVFVPDVGPVVVDLASDPAACGTWWNYAGAGLRRNTNSRTLSLRARNVSRNCTSSENRLRILGLFNPFMREFVEMHYLQTTPVLLDDSELTALIGPLKKTSYLEGIARTAEATHYQVAAPAILANAVATVLTSWTR